MNQPYPKVGVGVIVIKNESGKRYVMLHQRKGSLGKNYWGSGGGHLELGESLRAGALRELAEEAGPLVVDKVTFLGVVNFTEMQPKHYVDVSFSAQWVSGEPTNNSPRETSEWQWFDIDNLPSPLFPPLEKYFVALKTEQAFFDSSFS
ncbi:MAG: NUDIX domain-containing protein [Candidatus Saccharimonadales bacterium]